MSRLQVVVMKQFFDQDVFGFIFRRDVVKKVNIHLHESQPFLLKCSPPMQNIFKAICSQVGFSLMVRQVDLETSETDRSAIPKTTHAKRPERSIRKEMTGIGETQGYYCRLLRASYYCFGCLEFTRFRVVSLVSDIFMLTRQLKNFLIINGVCSLSTFLLAFSLPCLCQSTRSRERFLNENLYLVAVTYEISKNQKYCKESDETVHTIRQ